MNLHGDPVKITQLTTLMDKRIKEGMESGRYAGKIGDTQRDVERVLRNLLCHAKGELPRLDGYFHKAFRQTSVTSSSQLDMAIWHLLNASELFWECFDIVRGVKDDGGE